MIDDDNIQNQMMVDVGQHLYRKSCDLVGVNDFLVRSGLSSRNKQEQIASYLIYKVLESNPYDKNLYTFNRKSLAKHFDCSMLTVNRTLKALRNHDKYVTIIGNVIRLNVEKGGDHHDE